MQQLTIWVMSYKILAQARHRNLLHGRSSWGQCYEPCHNSLYCDGSWKPLCPLGFCSEAAGVHWLLFDQYAPLEWWRCNLILGLLEIWCLLCFKRILGLMLPKPTTGTSLSWLQAVPPLAQHYEIRIRHRWQLTRKHCRQRKPEITSLV